MARKPVNHKSRKPLLQINCFLWYFHFILWFSYSPSPPSSLFLCLSPSLKHWYLTLSGWRMRGMPELSEAILYTHLSAKRSSKAESQRKIKLGRLGKMTKMERVWKWTCWKGEGVGKNEMIMEEVKHGGGKIGDRKAKPWLNSDKGLCGNNSTSDC